MQVCRLGELGKQAISMVIRDHRGLKEDGANEQVWQKEGAGKSRL